MTEILVTSGTVEIVAMEMNAVSTPRDGCWGRVWSLKAKVQDLFLSYLEKRTGVKNKTTMKIYIYNLALGVVKWLFLCTAHTKRFEYCL